MPYVPMLVAAGLEGFVGLLSVIMSITCCICIRTYGDNARRGFWWLWYAYFFLFLGGVAIAVNNGWLAYFLSYSQEGWMHYLPGPDIIPFHAGRLFIRIANILMFLMITKLAMALLYVWGQHHKKHRVFHYIVHFLCVLTLASSIAACAGSTTYYWDMMIDSRLQPFKYIAVATDGLFFIFFTFTLGLCIRVIVVGKRKVKSYNRKVPDLLLASAIFAWISSVWGAYFSVKINILLYDLALIHFIIPNVAFLFTDFIALTLLFAAGRRQRGGLYSIARPEELPRKLQLGSSGFHNYEGVSLHGADGDEHEPLRAHGADIDGAGHLYDGPGRGPNKFHYPPEKGPSSPEVKASAGHYEYA